MTQTVAVFGCGPSGLLVAHAAAISGWNFRVYSHKRKSVFEGAQYLHEAIPGMTSGNPVLVDYVLEGTPEQYREKVYGKDFLGTVSPEEFGGDSHYAWDLHACYDRLWHAYNGEIVDRAITGRPDDKPWIEINPDVVVSTISRRVFDPDPSHFSYVDSWIITDNFDTDRHAPFGPRDDNTVICDGTADVGWHRISNLFGRKSIEWPGHLPKPPVEGIAKVRKPIAYSGDAAPEFVHLGRYAQHEKGVLTTDVFNAALKLFGQ